jgi:ABC-type transporter Mla subunit MlaD
MMASGKQLAGTLSDSSDLLKKWIEDNDDKLTATVDSAQTIAKDIESLTVELETYKARVASILENSDVISGDARLILERNGPVVEDMLGDLREAMRFFVSFAEVLADNPQALLRGQREGGRETSTQGSLGREPDR